MSFAADQVVENVVELVGIFPTVSHLAGLKTPPPCPEISFKVSLIMFQIIHMTFF